MIEFRSSNTFFGVSSAIGDKLLSALQLPSGITCREIISLKSRVEHLMFAPPSDIETVVICQFYEFLRESEGEFVSWEEL